MPSAKITPNKGTAKKDAAKAPGSKVHGTKAQGARPPRAKPHVFLVAVKRRREALRVYAVQSPSEAVALAIVEAASAEDASVEPVGRLSKKLARPLKLLTGEPHPI